MKSIKFVAIFLFLLPNLVFAKSAGWSGVGKVTSLYAINNDQVLLKLTDFENPGQCLVNANGDIVVNPTTHPTWFSMLLSAYMSGKDVNIFVVSSCTEVWANTSYADIGHVRMLD